MFYLGWFLGFIVCSIVYLVLHYMDSQKTRCGTVDASLNTEDMCWDCKLHIPVNVDYSKVKKIVLIVNHK